MGQPFIVGPFGRTRATGLTAALWREPHRASTALLLIAVSTVVWQENSRAQRAAPAWTASLDEVRIVASRIPGRRPLRINVLKFAESHRTKNFSVKGAPAVPSVQARTAFQIVYADGTIMVDAGMDPQVHAFFGRGVSEPYDTAAALQVERALRSARLIVLTHEHGDHAAGVIHTPMAGELAPKTLLTRAQLDTLMTNPQMPEIRLDPRDARRYGAFDYDRYFPLAPGVALIKSPGHTLGSQMVYVALESGKNYLLIGDVAWHMDDVRAVAGKDAPWVVEDRAAVMDQLEWLNELTRAEPGLVIVPSHDEDQRQALVREGLLGDGFE